LLVEIDRKSGVPLYIQVKEGIKRQIASGALGSGAKLPTERELAETLSVSRNTISMAYQELESEGVLASHQGRGTFVADEDQVLRNVGRKERLLRVIDLALEEALELGVNMEEFVALTMVRAREKQEMVSRLRVGFIECNQEQLDFFVRELGMGTGVTILPILLEDLRRHSQEAKAVLSSMDIIVTTVFHLQEVKDTVRPLQRQVIGIALDPELETIVKIARLPRESRLGIVCSSEKFSLRMVASLKKAGLSYFDPVVTITSNPEELEEFLRKLDAVLVSPHRLLEVKDKVGEAAEVIEFRYFPDAGSINLLKTALLDLRERNRS